MVETRITETAISFTNLNKRHIRHDPILDGMRRYVTDAPTLTGISALLKNVDDGDFGAMIEMCEEMERKDAHLQDVAARRREGLTALDWTIEPDPSAADPKAATKAAEFCQRQLDGLKAWPLALDHLAEAIGPGLAVLELIWHRGRLVDLLLVPGARLQGNLIDGSGVYVETADNPMPGIKAEAPKWVVHMPQSRAGEPMRVTLGHAQAKLWVIKHFALADWTAFSEVFGQPIRHGQLLEGATPEDGRVAQAMLENMGADLWALSSDKLVVTLLEAARGTQPFEGLVDWTERKAAILYLGQTLTTEQETTGSLALGKVHANVRTSITVSDMKKEARTIREQILRHMILFRFPTTPMPVPYFKRVIVEEAQLDAQRLTLDKLRFMKEQGLLVDSEYVYESLGIPRPKEPGQLPGDAEPGREVE